MAQQINLYNYDLRRQREWLTLTHVGLVAAVIFVAVAFAGSWVQVQAKKKKTQAVGYEAQLNAMQQELAILAGQLGAPQAAELGLASLKQQVATRREVLQALQGGAGPAELQEQRMQGFSDYLRGLARQSVTGLWLTGFSVAQGGGGMEVRGRMLAADRLPAYIQRLNGEPYFRGRQFVSLNILRSDRAPDGAKTAIKSAGSTTYASFLLTAVPADKNDLAKPKEGGAR